MSSKNTNNINTVFSHSSSNMKEIVNKYGFELHHIVPLLYATNRNQFDVLDTWKNMIYIDGFTHNIITQTKTLFFHSTMGI